MVPQGNPELKDMLVGHVHVQSQQNHDKYGEKMANKTEKDGEQTKK